MKVIKVLIVLILLTSCRPTATTQQQEIQQQVQQEMAERETYVSTHNVEFDNYNKRQEIADDPTTLLWCTFFPPTMGQEPFTVPIVGKLTSGNKRPFPSTEIRTGGEWDVTYNPELPQPDGMYGSSGQYRYGFTPAGYYTDYTGLASFCTTQPTIWQRNQTQIVFEVDTEYAEMQVELKSLLGAGDFEGAAALFNTATITETQ